MPLKERIERALKNSLQNNSFVSPKAAELVIDCKERIDRLEKSVQEFFNGTISSRKLAEIADVDDAAYELRYHEVAQHKLTIQEIAYAYEKWRTECEAQFGWHFEHLTKTISQSAFVAGILCAEDHKETV